MHRYSRAYRDASSPLTPLTPLSTNVFDFNIETGPSSSTLALPRRRNERNAAPPHVCQRVSNCAGSTTRVITPQSCESALRKRNNYVKVIAGLGRENTVAPIPPTRTKRAIKQETKPMCSNMPLIKLEPPPRTKRRGTRELLNASVQGDAYPIEGFLASGRPTSPRHQQQQLEPRHFDSSNIRISSPVAPKPMSPRFGEFLARWGINCLKSIFERQEIDLQTFCCLTADDLECLGIQDPANRERVIQAINFVSGLKRET